MKVLVTGASGFVGRAVCAALAASGHQVRAALRRPAAPDLVIAESVIVGDIDGNTDWAAALDGIDAVVHLAAVTHGDALADPAAAGRYQRVNVDGTAALTAQASAAGVRRFVFMSSVKVLGESSPIVDGVPVALSGDSPPHPHDHYGRSKLAAEQKLLATIGLEAVILRPPLVYGPGQKGNLAALARAIRRRVPLPLGAIRNRRSMIGVENLAAAVVCAVESAGIGGTTLTLADSEVSTPELVRALAAGVGLRPLLVPVPAVLLRAAGAATARSDVVARVLGSLVVDASEARAVLGWQPRVAFDDGMRAAGRWHQVHGFEV